MQRYEIIEFGRWTMSPRERTSSHRKTEKKGSVSLTINVSKTKNSFHDGRWKTRSGGTYDVVAYS